MIKWEDSINLVLILLIMICKHVLFITIQYLFVIQVSAFQRQMPQSNDTALFRSMLESAKHVLIISGPGLSADCGISVNPFEKWRGLKIQELDSYDTFVKSPSLFWEFNQYKRNLMIKAQPNQAYIAIANYEKYLRDEGKGRKLTIITENIDGLHLLAGSTDVIEMEGNIFKTKCLLCGQVVENRVNPICPSLKGRGSPLEGNYTEIPKPELPRCTRQGCGGLLRPAIVLFGENLEPKEVTKTETSMKSSDICLVIGASPRMNPVAMIAPQLAARGVPVGEFNSQPTDVTELLKFVSYFVIRSYTEVPNGQADSIQKWVDVIKSGVNDWYECGMSFGKYDFIRHIEPSNDEVKFKQLLKPAKNVLVISGPEITAASGLPTKPWGEWRGHSSESLDTFAAFNKSPALIWEYTQYRRDLVLASGPNLAHIAIANYEKSLRNEGSGRQLKVFTHNIDSLQTKAGSKDVVELEGSLFKTKCLACGHVEENWDNPVCPALLLRGSRLEGDYPEIKEKDLPHCKKPGCRGLLRPFIKWSDEKITSENIRKAGAALKTTDFCILVGISTLALKNPLGHIPPTLARHNHTIAEFSLQKTYGPPHTSLANFLFEGPCTKTIPDLLRF